MQFRQAVIGSSTSSNLKHSISSQHTRERHCKHFFIMRRSGPHEALSDGNGLKFLYRTNAAFSLLGGPKAVSQDPSIATTLTSNGFAKRRASGAALPASGNRLSLGATPAEPVVLKLSELMAQTQASRMIGSAKVSRVGMLCASKHHASHASTIDQFVQQTTVVSKK